LSFLLHEIANSVINTIEEMKNNFFIFIQQLHKLIFKII